MKLSKNDYKSILNFYKIDSDNLNNNQIKSKAEDILLDELPVMPIYIYTRLLLKSPDVQGWCPNVEDIHPLKFVSIK